MQPFSSPLLGQGGTPTPTPTPLPTIPSSANIRYWFMADRDCYSDTGGTVPCVDGAGVALWGNQGTQEDATQPTSARRPIWKASGSGGKPYIQATAANAQYFENLLITSTYNNIPTSQTQWNGWGHIALVFAHDSPTDGKHRAIMENMTGTAVTRCGVFFRNTTLSMRWFKNGFSYKGCTAGQTHLVVHSFSYNANARRAWEDLEPTAFSDGSNANTTAVSSVGFLRGSALGSQNSPADQAYWNGRIHEMIMWQDIGMMSATDMDTVQNYLKAKYSI